MMNLHPGTDAKNTQLGVPGVDKRTAARMTQSHLHFP